MSLTQKSVGACSLMVSSFNEDTASDEEIIALARNPKTEESKALELNSIIISRHIKLIELKARRFKNSTLDEEDLISEGFLGFLSALRTYSAEKGLFKTYASVCVANKMKSALLLSANKPINAGEFDFRFLADETSYLEDMVIEKEEEKEIKKLLENLLSPLEYKVIALYLNAYSYKHISEKIGISVKSVGNSLSRARAKLKIHYSAK